ncbi:MAG: histidine ammonia-lyase, partial [Methanomassiliicoccus sp.]
IVSENKVLVHPASASSIPTSANQEDFNSMGTIAAWKARTIVENVSRVVAIEMIAAAQALDFISAPPSAPIQEVRSLLRSKVSRLDKDRSLSEDIESVARMILDGVFVDTVEHTCGFQRA